MTWKEWKQAVCYTVIPLLTEGTTRCETTKMVMEWRDQGHLGIHRRRP